MAESWSGGSVDQMTPLEQIAPRHELSAKSKSSSRDQINAESLLLSLLLVDPDLLVLSSCFTGGLSSSFSNTTSKVNQEGAGYSITNCRHCQSLKEPLRSYSELVVVLSIGCDLRQLLGYIQP